MLKLIRAGPVLTPARQQWRKLITFEHRDAEATVLFVTNMWPTASRPTYGVFVKRQVDSLKSAGVRCDVLFVRGYLTPLAYIAATLLFAYWNLAPAGRYRLVHALAGEVFPAARCYVRAPLIVSFRGSDLLGAPESDGRVRWRWRVRRTILRRLSVLAQGVITETAQMDDRLPRAVRDRSAVVPTGIDRAEFAPADRIASRKKLDWSLDEHVVLFAADPARPLKRFWLAEAACRVACAQVSDIRLLVAYRESPEAMPTLMNASDCLLLTSASEGSPNVVKEALACNLPVVATKAGNVQELLAGVHPSFACEPTARELGASLVLCLSSRTRSNGRYRTQHLALQTIARELLAYYGKVTGHKQGDGRELNLGWYRPQREPAQLDPRGKPRPNSGPSRG